MKRILLLCLTISLMCIMFCCPISAEEYTDPYDSRIIPDAIMEIPEYKDAEMVFLYYDLDIGYELRTKGNIENVLADSSPVYVFIKPHPDKSHDVVVNYYTLTDGKAVLGENQNFIVSEMAMEEFKTQAAIKAVAPDICVESIYYFYDHSHHHIYDLGLYYKTNLGDYVFFQTESIEMLLTAERFLEYAAASNQYAKDMYKEHGTLMGGRYTLGTEWTVYHWNSPDFAPDAPLPIEDEEAAAPDPTIDFTIYFILGGIVLAAAAVTTVIIIRKRKKNAAPEVTEEIPEET